MLCLTECNIPILYILICIEVMDIVCGWVVYEVKGILKWINAWKQSSLISLFAVHCIVNEALYCHDYH